MKYHIRDSDSGYSFRGITLLDPEGIVQFRMLNDLPIGLGITEAVRLVKACKESHDKMVVIGPDWEEGDPTLGPVIPLSVEEHEQWAAKWDQFTSKQKDLAGENWDEFRENDTAP